MLGEDRLADLKRDLKETDESCMLRRFGLKEKIRLSYQGGVAVCRQCDATVKCTGCGTSNMSTHMRRHHSDMKTEFPKLEISPASLSHFSTSVHETKHSGNCLLIYG